MLSIESNTTCIDRFTSISRLDPLGLDESLHNLPEINRTHDITSLRNTLTTSVENYNRSPSLSADAALAALRDLDFLASSYQRQGGNPIKSIPYLEECLLELGAIANTVPRGTVMTYALVNPSGNRERSFTGSQEEALFIDSVRMSSTVLEESLQEFVYNDLSSALATLDLNLDVTIQAIVSVMRSLSPEYFTNELRPYFDPLTIGGEKFLGSGGAQLQFVAFDYILWGANEGDEMYAGYFNENYAYLSPSQRESIDQILEKFDSDTIIKHIALNHDKNNAELALAVLKKMKKFRYPHRKLAQDNFKVRPAGQVGSGSYTTNILDVLIDKTEQSIEVLEGIIAE